MSDANAKVSGRPHAIRLPRLGQEIEEVTVVAWLVKEGAWIEKGQPICEIETAKAVVELEADQAGRVARIVAQAGDTIKEDAPLAYLAESDAELEAWLALQEPAEQASQVCEPCARALEAPGVRPTSDIAGAASSATRSRVSPAARRLARQTGTDLRAIAQGSGPEGRILSTDVLAASTPLGNCARRPASAMRRAIARALVLSKQTIPHFYARMTIDAASALEFHKERKQEHACSLNHVILAACAKALREFPALRCRLEGDDLVELRDVNIGVAVGLEDGLVVPVIQRADCLSFKDLCLAAERVVASARRGRLEGAGKGVFTVTNLGMFGIEEFAAIIQPGESAILAVGAAREAAIAKNGLLRAGWLMTLTLSCDHRIVDGTMAARFLQRLRQILENPRHELPLP